MAGEHVMPLDLSGQIALTALIFLVAMIYASVGHGGASGYLAVLSLFSFQQEQMAGTALILNVAVSSLAFWSFMRRGHLLPRFAWLLVLTSIPFSFIGGTMHVSSTVYKVLLAFALSIAALRLLYERRTSNYALTEPHAIMLGGVGGSIGLVSGIVGVGGGIFLSPVSIFFRWTTVKSAATLSALFILSNSMSGLAGRVVTGKLAVAPVLPLLAAAIAGGVIGAWLGSARFSNRALRVVLAAVLMIAVLKLLLTVK
ncbi:sulfite exporter TauE/SafE family protein [bacterium]|nr:sulfite exporter TauE/SafE family protein [bacterium]